RWGGGGRGRAGLAPARLRGLLPARSAGGRLDGCQWLAGGATPGPGQCAGEGRAGERRQRRGGAESCDIATSPLPRVRRTAGNGKNEISHAFPLPRVRPSAGGPRV